VEKPAGGGYRLPARIAPGGFSLSSGTRNDIAAVSFEHDCNGRGNALSCAWRFQRAPCAEGIQRSSLRFPRAPLARHARVYVVASVCSVGKARLLSIASGRRGADVRHLFSGWSAFIPRLPDERKLRAVRRMRCRICTPIAIASE
jgi:hypothetical protein